jgi:hypothetical protein
VKDLINKALEAVNLKEGLSRRCGMMDDGQKFHHGNVSGEASKSWEIYYLLEMFIGNLLGYQIDIIQYKDIYWDSLSWIFTGIQLLGYWDVLGYYIMNQYLIFWFVNGRFTPCRSHVYCKWGK